MSPSPADPSRRPQLRVRRLPDERGLVRTRKQYEVGCFTPGVDTPVRVRRTDHPRSVLRDEGVHTTDIHDYVARADAAWDGGIGPWRSGFPGEDG